MTPQQKVKTSAGMETATETVNRVKAAIEPTKTPTKLNADTLAPQPEFKLTPPPPATEAAALGGVIEAQTEQNDAFVKNLEAQKTAAEGGKSKTLSDLVTALQARQGLEARTLAAEAETGVSTAESALQDINNQILQEQRGLKKAKEAVLAAGGQSKAQAQAQIANLERESYSKQADMAVIQLAAQGKYDSAKAIADRKAKAMFEQEQNEIEALQFNYLENKDLFTKAEQRLFETNLSDRNRELDAKREEVKQIQSLAIQALADGAPPSIVAQMQQAKTIAEATQLGGGYIGALDREAKRANIAQSYASMAASRTNQLLALAEAGDPEAIKQLKFDPRAAAAEAENLDPTTKRQVTDQLQAGEQLLNLASQYKKLIDEKGFENTFFGSQETVGQYRALRSQITAAYKDAKKLGTLDAGLLALMEGIIGEEPTSGAFTPGANFFGGRSTRISKQLQELIDATSSENAKAMLRLGINPTILAPDDIEEINNALGATSASTPSGTDFNPANFYTQ